MSRELPELPKPYRAAVFATSENTPSVRKGFEMGGYEKAPPLYTADQLLAFAEEAVRLERERLGLPKSYGGSTFASWGDQKEGCTVRLHFKDAKEAEQWFNRLTDGWDAIRARSQEGRVV